VTGSDLNGLSSFAELIANVFESVAAVDSGPIIDSLKGESSRSLCTSGLPRSDAVPGAELPSAISSAYLAQANFWLTWLPMRGFLAYCEWVARAPFRMRPG